MRGIRILFFCVALSLLFPKTAYAEEIVPDKETMDVVFVIDCSGSMKTNDPSKMGLSMVQAFIDTVQTENIRVGYVAYNDSILAFSAPESIAAFEKRELLKEEIGAITYGGDTDIGMGVSYAYGLFSTEENARQIMVLISDGETDLPRSSERTKEQSDLELEQCVRQCVEENVQIYTVAFGQYDGSKEYLNEIAAQTGAESYSVRGSEELIEVLYGIFQDSLTYKIQQFSSGTYAGGSQEIKCVLDAPYLDEINILLLSSEPVGETIVRYGTEEIPLTGLSNYAVGKIENAEADAAGRELMIRSETGEGQDLQVYIISYRKLTPVLQIAASVGRNQELEYQVYFKDKDGNVIHDAGFYKTFFWEFSCDDRNMTQEAVDASEGVLKGKVRFSRSGIYALSGTLSDEFGSFSFSVQVEATNAMPTGSIPEDTCTRLDSEWTLCLDDYFMDADNDLLSYSITDTQEGVAVRLEENFLTISPQSTGTHTVTIQISDGESAVQYVHHVKVIPLWKVYWWVLALTTIIVAGILWKLLHKPKPELERLTEEKKQNHFCGKLDAYFIRQPEGEEEIPPLSFQMNKVKDGRVSLGALFGTYPEQVKALQLDEIFLIADENHSMILYHRSNAGVMVGNAIACMQIQYSISFGDIIYITSPEGSYDLEIHYVAVFQ
ncbi:MAG: VWA domain-containing protein [Lachnospiraceae bacterium]|nr:VWA domain-containing protein [Lachnospiraceae bacterium]MBD5541930.1 VWA domain-containing protein [Lachnospiraceae bacterium]